MLGKIFEKYDQGMMYLANKAVKSYNWTTGKTKGDFANGLLNIAPILESTGLVAKGIADDDMILKVYGLGVFAPIVLLWSHHTQKRNKSLEQKEEVAKRKHAKDLEVEIAKKDLMWGGARTNILAGFYTLLPDKTSMLKVSGGGLLMRSFANYIMRTENPPKRKDCVRRSLDKLKEVYESLRPKPSLGNPRESLTRKDLISYLEAA